jgi:hypothetical protein
MAAGCTRRSTVGVSVAVLLLALLALAVAPANSEALLVSETRVKSKEFSGAGCGSESVLRVFLPSRARDVRLVRPRQGAGLRDVDTGRVVARLRVQRTRVRAKRAIRVTAVGSDDACTNPDTYQGFDGWLVGRVQAKVRYVLPRRVFFRSFIQGTYLPRAFRPARILFGSRTGITGVRWSRWNGRVAAGSGTLLYNDCMPNCATARPQRFRVAIKLSRPRECSGRHEYTRFAFRYPGARPAGLPRTYSERHAC